VKIRPLISKILGPPAVLFLVYIGCSVAYQLIWGTIDGARKRRQAATIVEDFHLRFTTGNFEGVCEDASPIVVSKYGDCAAVLRDVRTTYGRFKRLKIVHFQVIGEPPWVEAKCVAEFERGELQELFLLSGESDHGLRVFGYWPTTEISQRVEK